MNHFQQGTYRLPLFVAFEYLTVNMVIFLSDRWSGIQSNDLGALCAYFLYSGTQFLAYVSHRPSSLIDLLRIDARGICFGCGCDADGCSIC